jgi:hypothetical protein
MKHAEDNVFAKFLYIVCISFFIKRNDRESEFDKCAIDKCVVAVL